MRPLSIQARLWLVFLVLLLIGTLLLVGRRHMLGAGLQASFDPEFFTRPDGYPALARYYGLHFTRPPIQMDPGLKYRALADGLVDVIDGYTTDGRILAYDLKILTDDRHFFPPYDTAPLVGGRTLARHPELRDLLNRLKGRIDNRRMQQMNLRVDQGGETARAVAHAFLIQEGLIAPGAKPPAPGKEKIVIGGKPFTEQEILGEIMAQLIESRAGLAVDRKFNLGGTLICFEALRTGGIDLYPEYTGTGLMTILHHGIDTDPQKVYGIVRQEFERRWGLVWLEPFGMSDSYALTMRRAQAQALGIRTISDLAAYMDRQSKNKP